MSNRQLKLSMSKTELIFPQTCSSLAAFLFSVHSIFQRLLRSQSLKLPPLSPSYSISNPPENLTDFALQQFLNFITSNHSHPNLCHCHLTCHLALSTYIFYCCHKLQKSVSILLSTSKLCLVYNKDGSL